MSMKAKLGCFTVSGQPRSVSVEQPKPPVKGLFSLLPVVRKRVSNPCSK